MNAEYGNSFLNIETNLIMIGMAFDIMGASMFKGYKSSDNKNTIGVQRIF